MAQVFNTAKFGSLADDMVVWRHLDLLKFLSLLIDGELFFPNAQYFSGDRREGTFPDHQEDQLADSYQVTLPAADVAGALSRHQIVKQIIQGMARGKYFISCWYRSPYESDAMWRLYSGAIALKTTVGRLHGCIQDPVNTKTGVEMNAYISNVKYIDFNSDTVWEQLNGGSVMDMVLHKRHYFDYEKEVRIVLEAPISIQEVMEFGNLTAAGGVYYRSSGDCLNCKSNKESVSVAVDIEQLVEEFVLSPYAQGQLRAVVEHLVEKYCPAVPVRQSALV